MAGVTSVVAVADFMVAVASPVGVVSTVAAGMAARTLAITAETTVATVGDPTGALAAEILVARGCGAARLRRTNPALTTPGPPRAVAFAMPLPDGTRFNPPTPAAWAPDPLLRVQGLQKEAPDRMRSWAFGPRRGKPLTRRSPTGIGTLSAANTPQPQF